MNCQDFDPSADILASVRDPRSPIREALSRALEMERREQSLRGPLSPVWDPQIAKGSYHRNDGLLIDSEQDRNQFDQHPVHSAPRKMFENSRPFYGEAGLAENVPLNPPVHFPMEVDDDSSIRSSEMKVDRAAMAAANRMVRDQLAVDGALRGVGYSQTLDRPVRHNGDGLHPPPPFSSTLPRGYPRQEAFPHQPEAYASLLRGARVDQRYEPPADVYRGPGYAAQPQVLPHSRPERFMSEPYGLEDEQRSLGYEDGDYPLGMDYGTARRAGTPSELKNRYLRR
ncbi:catenin delta-1-like [Rhinoraja longicauda]